MIHPVPREHPHHTHSQRFLPMREVERRLGRTAFRVWRVLLRSRKSGTMRAAVTARDIGVRTDCDWPVANRNELPWLAPRTVEKALRKLRRVGLVSEVVSYPLRIRPRTPWRPIVTRVPLRRVLGGLAVVEGANGPQSWAAVPWPVGTAILRCSTWGGRRAGAGRPLGARGRRRPAERPRGYALTPASGPVGSGGLLRARMSREKIKWGGSIDLFSYSLLKSSPYPLRGYKEEAGLRRGAIPRRGRPPGSDFSPEADDA